MHNCLTHNYFFQVKWCLMWRLKLLSKVETIILKCLFNFVSIKQNVLCCNLSFRLTTKAMAYKGASQKWTWESHLMFLGVQESVREWTLALPSELPFWELESQWIPKFSKGDCKFKTHWIKKFFISLENFWNLDV
jgi:hypothetical protein